MYRFVNIIEHHLKHDTTGFYISIKSARGMKHASIMSSYIAAIVFLRTNYICKKKLRVKIKLDRLASNFPFTDFLAVGHTWKIFAYVDDLFWLMDN